MWRDELQAWLLARDSGSILELLQNLKYEGHTPLWYLLLYPLTRTFASPVAMQVLHLFIAAGFVYLFGIFAPFSRLQKTLFVFGFYVGYQYTVVSRGYMLGFLFIELACIFYPTRVARPLRFLGVLFLASMTSVLAMILAGGCALTVASRKNAIAVFLVSVTAVVWLLFPWYMGKIFDPFVLGRYNDAARRVFFAVFPLHDMKLAYNLQGLAGVLILAVFGLLTHPIRSVFLVYLAGMGCLLFFMATLYRGGAWHVGFIFMFMIFLLWLLRIEGSPQWKKTISRVLSLGLAFQMLVWIKVAHEDVIRPYSSGKAVAEYLVRSNRFKEALISVDPDFTGAAIAGYLHQRLYYPRSGREGTYVVWDHTRQQRMSVDKVVELSIQKARELKRDLVMILNEPLSEEQRGLGLTSIAKFEGAMVESEDFYLYFYPLERRP